MKQNLTGLEDWFNLKKMCIFKIIPFLKTVSACVRVCVCVKNGYLNKEGIVGTNGI